MDQPVPKQAPYFDLDLLRHEASELARAHSGQDSKLRVALVERLRQLGRGGADAAARRQLEEDGDGRACAAGLSAFQDALIKLAYDFTTTHVYPRREPDGRRAHGHRGARRLWPRPARAGLRHRSPVPAALQADRLGRERRRIHALSALGSRLQGRPRHAQHRSMRASQPFRHDHPHRAARCAADPRRRGALSPIFSTASARRCWRAIARAFIEAKLAEQNVRHARAGASRYLVEPNVKDGKGGLRDLHTLHWLAKHLYPDKAEAEFVEAGVFTATNIGASAAARASCGRCAASCTSSPTGPRSGSASMCSSRWPSGSAIAGHAGLSAVERFMKHYFLVAKEVGDLTGIVCSALEMKQLKSLPALDTLLAPFSWRRRAKLRRTSDFRIENGRISAVNKDAFAKDPVNFIRLFSFADEHQASFSPEVLRQVRSNFRLIDDKLRANPTANRLFMKLLTDSRDPEGVLRKMNEAGVLGRFIPDFGRVVSMMQFNMYHHFTVDEHLIRTIGFLSGIERGKFATEHPVSSEIVRTIDNRRALYVAALAARHRQGPRRGSFDRRRPHRPRARPTPRADAVGDRDGRLAGRASSVHEPVRPEPRPQRPQDAARFRRAGAEPRAAEAVAAAHRRRHPRRGAGRLDRLEGPAPAHALFRDRAACLAAAIRRSAAASAWPAPRMRCESGSPAGRSTTSSASSIATTRPIG